MKTLTLFLSALMLWGYSLSAAADPSCEGRFVNPITDVCWRCIFPLSLGSVQVGKGDLPDTSNPGNPLQLCPAPVSYTHLDVYKRQEQANEKAKLKEERSDAKPAAAGLPQLAEGNFCLLYTSRCV